MYEITIVKEGGYNQWTAATKSDPTASARPASAGTATPGYSPTTTPRSTYETPEERAKKQVYIVRQSSISNAVAILSVGSKARPDVKEIIDVATQLEDYVFGRDEAKAAEYATTAKSSDLDDDIPFN